MVVGYLTRISGWRAQASSIWGMRRLVIAAIAAGVALSGCGSSGEAAVPVASVESADSSGGVAEASEWTCPSGPPARGVLTINTFDAGHGVVGQLYNETGSTLWVWSRKMPGFCQLEAGRSTGFAVGSSAVFTVTAERNFEKAPGVGIRIEDKEVLSPRVSTFFQRASLSRCASDGAELEAVLPQGDSEELLEGVAQGSVLAKRLPDNDDIAREWLTSGASDNFSRIDLFIRAIGTC